MVATLIETERRHATQSSATDRMESLVPTAVRLSQSHDQGELSDQEFESRLSHLFQWASDARAPVGTDYLTVHFDWSGDPVKVAPGDSPASYEPLYIRTDQLLQGHFGYGWEYRGGCPQDAVRFDQRPAGGTEGETQLLIVVHGAWVDLER